MMTVYKMADNPYLTQIIVAIVTKTGMYLDNSQARWLIAQGKVSIDGEIEDDEAEEVESGIHEFQIGEKKYVVEVRDVNVL